LITAVDANILFDVLIPDPDFRTTSLQALAYSSRLGDVLISEPVYAEVGGFFASKTALDSFFAEVGIRLQASGPEGLHLAGGAWRNYARQRPPSLVCPRCGASNEVRCSQCDASIRSRQHVVADFIIGAHAVIHADRLLTRDAGHYRTYFPQLVLA
jgi:predicted nucleic acid-binding protein